MVQEHYNNRKPNFKKHALRDYSSLKDGIIELENKLSRKKMSTLT